MSKQPAHNLTMIPGPIEFDDDVLTSMSHYSVAHTAQPFVDTFSSVLKSLRTLFLAKDPKAQPFVIAGGGTLGWDLSAANFLEKGDKVLVLSTGFFSDSWAKALKAYDIDVTEIKAEIGDRTPLDKVEEAIKKEKYAAVTITQVDTSTAVLQDVKALSELVHKVSPESLVFVDGVCSIAVEEFRFDDWKIDFVLTASQKAIGAPAGLSISVASSRALEKLKSRKNPVPSFYGDLGRWLPIMQAYESGKPAYFSTPAVQNIYALKTSLDDIVPSEEALVKRWAVHKEASDKFKDLLEKLGANLLAKNRDVAAHGLTAAYAPEGVQVPDLIKAVLQHGFVIAGGILPPIAAKYFRVGHMGVAVTKYDYLKKLEEVIPKALASAKK